ncbi:MAG: GNAT family N-acetyltransferase [Steroidobacteraceae bacterium]|jgi:GNAT superfamily N-acetyltransferase
MPCMRVVHRIAPLRVLDRTRWEQLWSDYQQFYGIQLPAAATEATWLRLHHGRIHGLGARDADDRLVGIVHFLTHEDTWSTKPACYLQDLYVDPSIRSKGCGTALIAAVAAAARTMGSSPPYWLTHESNAIARSLYDSVGRNHGFIQYTYLTPD